MKLKHISLSDTRAEFTTVADVTVALFPPVPPSKSYEVHTQRAGRILNIKTFPSCDSAMRYYEDVLLQVEEDLNSEVNKKMDWIRNGLELGWLEPNSLKDGMSSLIMSQDVRKFWNDIGKKYYRISPAPVNDEFISNPLAGFIEERVLDEEPTDSVPENTASRRQTINIGNVGVSDFVSVFPKDSSNSRSLGVDISVEDDTQNASGEILLNQKVFS